MKTKLLSTFTLFFYFICTSQVVNIPDPNFKSFLVNQSSVNTNGNAEIEVAEASVFSGTLFLNANMNINDITGIGAFTALQTFIFLNNNIGSADLSSNTSLTRLDFFNCGITNIILPNSGSLTELSLENNNLTSIDLSGLPNLEDLRMGDNNLSSLDLSNNLNLDKLFLNNNNLSVVNVSLQSNLQQLSLFSNNLTSIDVSNNLLLEFFVISSNNLTSIDVSANTALSEFQCDDNQITNLDLSSNPGPFVRILVFNNNLLNLNLANGNNSFIDIMQATNNPSLACINIDNNFTPPATWFTDTTTSYSDNCPVLSTDEFSFETISLYPNPTNSVLNIESSLDVSQIDVYSITGKVLKTIKNSEAIDVSDLQSGVYFVQVIGQNGAVSKSKFLKK